MVIARQEFSYEQCRQKRVEENKKRMEALNLPQLSQALRSPSSKPSPRKQVKPRTVEKQLLVVRRSSRVANKPSPVYNEDLVEKVMIPRRTYKSKGRDFSNRVYASDEARAEALEKAEALKSDLGPEFPVFIKSMLQSHVTGGFWLGLPSDFCREFLPKRDEQITLIDEEGEEYPTIYLSRKCGLSGGWRGFAIAHELLDGDAIVFQLVRPTTFKVYILRASGSEQNDRQ